jgi:hypothetical protein
MAIKGTSSNPARARSLHRWVRCGFITWAVIALAWLANSVRTRGVPGELLQSSQGVTVVDRPTALEFEPRAPNTKAALIFICGSGIHPHAYAPLLRPIAEAGHRVFIVKLPYRFAPLPAHKDEVVDQTRRLMVAHPAMSHWVVAGHSLGGALAARVAQTERAPHVTFVLIGTTHPKSVDLSTLPAPFTKVYALNDGVAPVERVMANRSLLPRHTKWVAIEGGNHSQFGHYGHQLFDGTPTIDREAQQAITRAALLDALRNATS